MKYLKYWVIGWHAYLCFLFYFLIVLGDYHTLYFDHIIPFFQVFTDSYSLSYQFGFRFSCLKFKANICYLYTLEHAVIHWSIHWPYRGHTLRGKGLPFPAATTWFYNLLLCKTSPSTACTLPSRFSWFVLLFTLQLQHVSESKTFEHSWGLPASR